MLAQWSVLKLENVSIQTAWTLTDTTYILDLQQWANISTNFKKVINFWWITFWKSNWTTPSWNLTWVLWDVCFWADWWKTYYCSTAGTTWTAF
jgi:hypothetical protein